MNLIEAKEKNLDVYMFAADAVHLQAGIYLKALIAGRVAFQFTDNIGTTTLRCVAVGPRAEAGVIARDMKARRKTVQSFIREQ